MSWAWKRYFRGSSDMAKILWGEKLRQSLSRERSHHFLIRGFSYFLPASNIIHDPQQLNSKQRTHTESKLLLDLQKTAADKGFDICDNPAQSNPIQSGNGVLDILSQQLRRVKGIKISHEEIRQELVTFLENFPNWVRTLLGRSLLLNLIRMI